MDNEDIQIEPAHLLAIIQQENPQAYELALRRAIIEKQREIIATLHGAAYNAAANGQPEVVG